MKTCSALAQLQQSKTTHHSRLLVPNRLTTKHLVEALVYPACILFLLFLGLFVQELAVLR